MKTLSCHLLLIAALSIAGCSAVSKVTEIHPGSSGFSVASKDSLASLETQISAAQGAWRKLDRNPSDTLARQEYNFAVSRIFGTLRAGKLAPWTAPLRTGSHTLTWQPHPKPVWNPALYELIPADQLKISGTYVNTQVTKSGLGAPLVAKRTADPVHEYAPTPHFFYAATGIARFEGAHCVLSLEDPLEAETVSVGGHSFPMAAGFTAPLAMMLEEMHPKKMGLPRLLHPAKYAATARIARLEPYDPSKTVVLLVHGLMSSPGTWLPLINHLRADEDIRRNYQFWFYSYPSGFPYPFSAATLRQELDGAERRHHLNKKIVVIGHSMGGCISRLLITDSGQRIWDQMFSVAPEHMEISPELRHVLTESSIFRHRPEIGRVIFISTPHRGADMAANWIGRLGARLVKLPASLLTLGQEEARYVTNPADRKYLDRFPNSIDTLAPDNGFVTALNSVPITAGIPYHTIAGDRGRGDSPNSSDGFVPYWSSHLPDAKSEKIVPTHHNAQQSTQAIEEVHRILSLHARESR